MDSVLWVFGLVFTPQKINEAVTKAKYRSRTRQILNIELQIERF